MPFDPQNDVPVQEKHPDWLKWFKKNDLDVERISVDPLPVYDPNTNIVTVFYFDLDPVTKMKKYDREDVIIKTHITRVVKTPPPWSL